MIYCIWYPSGGFGHFINAILSLYGKDFCRPEGQLTITPNGNSHSLPLVLPKYKNTENYILPPLDPSKKYSVLIDNGINDETTRFMATFPSASIIKMVYNDYSWPVVAQTHIIKAMNSAIDDTLAPDIDRWHTNDTWVQREKFFLYLRDHELRYKWRADQSCTLDVADLQDYAYLVEKIKSFGVELDNFYEDWTQWQRLNQKYFQPIVTASQVLDSIAYHRYHSLDHVKDVWTQAVVYYYLWLRYNKEVPHNDFANFFSSTKEILEWLDH